MFKLAVIVPFYKSVESSIEQEIIDEFSVMDKSVLKELQLIFIDDCSPIPLYPIIGLIARNLYFSHYHIDTDIQWNVGGAKNLGAHVADAEKLLFLDADHRVFEKVIKDLVAYEVAYCECVLLDRKYITAPGVFCIRKDRFIKLQGFDEKFSGHYGYEDKHFLNMHRYNGGVCTRVNNALMVRDNYRHHLLDRDTSYNKAFADSIEHSGLFLNFKWHQVF